jgi:eukaryotic-like serine/threonine-protein kinase
MNNARRVRIDRDVIETTSSADVTVPYMRRERVLPHRPPPRTFHGRSRAPADIASMEPTPPTIAMPRGRGGLLPLEPSLADEERLSSADIVWSEPLPRRAGVRAPPDVHAPPAPAADPLIGMTVADRYRIVEAIGRGGMGSVYKVEHTRIGKLLAMKLLAGELSQNPDAVRRFKREALTVSKLQCPNTVQVFDFGVSEGLTFLVMELVSGESLGRIVRQEGPMSSARMSRILIQICSSLAEAHDKGIVHRDIKPENIMILSAADGSDIVKVLDFGLAKLRETEGMSDVTCRGTIVGTPTYMAPEQIRGEDVDARTDVYSLGALMYRMVTGYAPFSAESPMEVLAMHLYESPVPPAERAPACAIPPGISRMIMRALRKDPADRFQRIEDLRALLVEDLRAAGSSSVESLLDPHRLRRMVRTAEPADAWPVGALATRSDVDAYERRLRRTRYGAAGTAVCVALAAAGAGAGLLVPRAAPARGVEIEPNDTAAEATPITIGQPMVGQIGRRLDATHGDRDFYAFEVPVEGGGKTVVRLRVSALPSMAMCTILYKPGFEEPLGQYCVGRPGKDLVVPSLELDPGRYLIVVLQDLDGRGGPPPLLQESISDTYTVLVERAAP